MIFTKTGDTTSFLKNGGEMGRLIREFNWAATPIGEPGCWPLSLKTIINVILNSRFPMFLWWGPHLVQFYNDAYRPSLGNNGKHPTALGERGEDCWPEIWPVIKPLIDQVFKTGEATWSEDQLIPIYRNGKLEDVYWTFGYSSVNDDSGQVGGVLVICNETTDKVNTLNKLAESENQLRFAVESAELGTWDYNPLTNKFRGNGRLKDWFGLLPQEEMDLSIAINIMDESDRQRVTDAIGHSLQYSSGGQYDIEYTIIHPVTRQPRCVRAKGRAWFNEEKIAYRFNGTLQDVTAQKQIEQQKDDFISLVSHELRTPLTSIMVYAEMLEEMAALPGNGQATIMFSKLNTQVDRLNLIIQDLLDVTRIEGSKIKFRKDHFDFKKLVHEIAEQIEYTNKTHTIIIDVPEEVMITADKERTSQVLLNLISNAVKYSPGNSAVVVSVRFNNDEIVCSVKDRGKGIEKDKHAKIFERFYQVAEVNKVNAGLGLGLYISAEIIKRQNGKIWVESKPGMGSVFYFSLPLKSV